VGLTAEVLSLGYGVVVIDDGSGAEFSPVFEGLDSRVILLRHEKNRGKGAGIKTGLSYVQEENRKSSDPFEQIRFVCIMDADGQHLPADMERVMAAAVANPDKLTLGVREVSGKMPLRSRMGNAITRGVFHLLTGTRVSDTQTGLRAFSVDLIPSMLTVEGNRYEYEMAVLTTVAHNRRGFVEVPIATLYEDRQNSTSHFRVVRDSLLIYKGLFKFAGSSFLSFLLDYLLFCGLVFLLRGTAASTALPYALIANILARIGSGTFNYLINCRLVFRRSPSWRSAGKYALLAACILALNTGVLYLWKLTPLPITVCKLFTEVCMFLLIYIVQKKLVFRKKKS
jgi:glycosyltransferase involved in cell wall biosynthesis